MAKQKIVVLFLFCFSLSRAQNNVRFTGVSLQGDSALNWSIAPFSEPFAFVLQQFRWNTWLDLDTVKGFRLTDTTFSCPVKRYTITGENKFRVKAVSKTMLIFSKNVKFTSNKAPAKKDIRDRYGKNNTNTVIDFGREEYFVLFDKFGNRVRSGLAQKVDIKGISPDIYYLSYGEIAGKEILYMP